MAGSEKPVLYISNAWSDYNTYCYKNKLDGNNRRAIQRVSTLSQLLGRDLNKYRIVWGHWHSEPGSLLELDEMRDYVKSWEGRLQ